MVVVDWAGTGRGPRLHALGFLLWAAGPSMPCVDAVISGYRAHVRLEPEERQRLAAAVSARPLILAGWAFATGRDITKVVAGLAATKARSEAIALRAGAALDAGD
jgi:hypothetical protein